VTWRHCISIVHQDLQANANKHYKNIQYLSPW
jgi:hypothetical protein